MANPLSPDTLFPGFHSRGHPLSPGPRAASPISPEGSSFQGSCLSLDPPDDSEHVFPGEQAPGPHYGPKPLPCRAAPLQKPRNLGPGDRRASS